MNNIVTSSIGTLIEAGELVIAIVGILLTIIIAKLYRLFYCKLTSRIIEKAKRRFGTVMNVGDVIRESLEKPIYWAILLIGFYISFLPIVSEKFLSLYKRELLILLAIVWGLFSSMKIIHRVIKWHISKEGMTRRRRTIFMSVKNIVDVFLYVIAILLILTALKVDITPLFLSLGVGTLAVALALQPTIANYFSGLYITFDKSVKVGDYIELENGLKGYILEIGWRATRIRTLPNNIVIIPNSKLTDMIVTNYSDPIDEMSFVLQCGVSYNSDLDKVEEVTIEVAKEILSKVEGGVKEFQPFIRYHTFAESNINFSIILRVREYVNQYQVTHEFIKALKKRFDKEGIEISFPSRNVYMREKK